MKRSPLYHTARGTFLTEAIRHDLHASHLHICSTNVDSYKATLARAINPEQSSAKQKMPQSDVTLIHSHLVWCRFQLLLILCVGASYAAQRCPWIFCPVFAHSAQGQSITPAAAAAAATPSTGVASSASSVDSSLHVFKANDLVLCP